MGDKPPSHWLARATPEEVGRLRRAVAAAAAERGLAGQAMDHLKLAVSEALTNAVLHAYPNGTSGPVSVEVNGDQGMVRVTVSDEGAGMTVRSPTHGLGLGLAIVASVSDMCEIRSVRGAGMRVMIGFGLNNARSQRTSR